MTDVTDNLTNKEWRVRISCCNALADLLKTNVQFNFIEYGPELWKKLFLIMDDIHEGTRLAATNTASILSKVSCKISVPRYFPLLKDLSNYINYVLGLHTTL